MYNIEELSISDIRRQYCQMLGTNQFWSLDKDFILIRSCHIVMPQDNFVAYGNAMLICNDGNCRCTLDGETYYLSAQSTIIILNRQHVRIIEASENFLFTLVMISQTFSEQLQVGNQFSVLQRARTIPKYTYREQEWQDFCGYMQLIESALRMTDYPYRSHIVRLLFEAQHYALGQHLQQPDAPVGRKDDISTRFSNLLTLEYKRHHSVAFYAERLCVTPKHLSECMKKTSGATAGEWIDRMLIRDAEQMLGNTQMSILEISQNLGFENPSAFGKYFKRIKGVSPKNYRDVHIVQ